jgi:hypothetical protein
MTQEMSHILKEKMTFRHISGDGADVQVKDTTPLLVKSTAVDEEVKLQSLTHVFLNIFKAVVGAGAVSLPAAFRAGGVWGSVVTILFCALLCDYTMKILVRSKVSNCALYCGTERVLGSHEFASQTELCAGDAGSVRANSWRHRRHHYCRHQLGSVYSVLGVCRSAAADGVWRDSIHIDHRERRRVGCGELGEESAQYRLLQSTRRPITGRCDDGGARVRIQFLRNSAAFGVPGLHTLDVESVLLECVVLNG